MAFSAAATSSLHHAVAIGYPYNPPPSPPPHPTFCCHCLCLCILLLMSLLTAIAGLAVSVYQEDQLHDPVFQVLDATATAVAVNIASFNTYGNGGGAAVTGRWNVTLMIRNPNTKSNVSYLDVHAKLWYKSYSEDVASTRLPPLFLDAVKETRVNVEFVSEKQFVNSDVARGIVEGGEEFGITVFVNLKLNDDELRSVDCYPIRMSGFESNINASSSLCVQSDHTNF